MDVFGLVGPWNSAVGKLQRIALLPADSAGRSITSVEVAGRVAQVLH